MILTDKVITRSTLTDDETEMVLATAQRMRSVAREARPDTTLDGKIVTFVSMEKRCPSLLSAESGALQLGAQSLWYVKKEVDWFGRRDNALKHAQTLGDLIVFHSPHPSDYDELPTNLTVPLIACGTSDCPVSYLSLFFKPELTPRQLAHTTDELESLRAPIYVSMALIAHVLGAVV